VMERPSASDRYGNHGSLEHSLGEECWQLAGVAGWYSCWTHAAAGCLLLITVKTGG